MAEIRYDNGQLLLEEIDRRRNKMIMTANMLGLNNEETIKCSQDLDVLLNLYDQIKRNYPNKARLSGTLLRGLLPFFMSRSLRIFNQIING